MIPVNKPYLPSLEKYHRYLGGIYERAWLTNNGPLVQELKIRLEDYLGVKNLLPVSNGTSALQLAFKALDVRGSAVTTPFTFVATSSALLWHGIEPIYADINSKNCNLDPSSAAQAIRHDTTAIVPVHVYGNPCDVEALQRLAEKKQVKLIYDAAHAIGIKLGQQSVLNYGDASTLSFHATKVFHTVEGGAVIFKDSDAYERAFNMTNFGIDKASGEIVDIGINAKMSEVHAAMGLAVLDDLDMLLSRRKEMFHMYHELLKGHLEFPIWHENADLNGAYMPVIFDNSDSCSRVLNGLAQHQIVARRYFAPSLDKTVVFPSSDRVPASNDLAGRILTLPLYYGLENKEINQVCESVKKFI